MSEEEDLLERATRALREETDPGAADERELWELRGRLLQSARVSRASRSKALRWVLPMAAAFVAGSAFAATNGQLERAVRAVEKFLAPESAPISQGRPRTKTKLPAPVPALDVAPTLPPPAPPVTPVSPTPAPAVVPVPAPFPAPAPVVASTPDRRSERASPPAPRPSAEAVPAPSPSAPENLDLARYREAHALHFRAQRAAEALAAWNLYLADFPGGTFALEARYNRAICLVRLGRVEDARTALTPFAEGNVGGGYRREQAQALLHALEPRP